MHAAGGNLVRPEWGGIEDPSELAAAQVSQIRSMGGWLTHAMDGSVGIKQSMDRLTRRPNAQTNDI